MNCDRRTRERLGDIEDRKIEILLELGRTNDRFSETVSRLNSEYRQLDAEHYRLRLKLMKDREQG